MVKPISVRVRTIQDVEGLSRIEDSWDSLVSKCSGNPFLLSGIMKSFIHLGQASGWNAVIVTVSRDKSLVGAAPLMVKKVYGFALVRFLLSPYFAPDFIVCSKDRDSYVSLFIEYVFNHLGCKILSLDFEAESQDPRSLKHAFKALGIRYSTASKMGHRVLPINSTWDEYVRSRGRNFIHKFRKIEKNLNERGEWKTVHVAGREIGPEILDKILEVERSSWKETRRARKGSAVDDELIAIWNGLKRITETPSDLEWIVSFLEIDDHPIAYSLTICYANIAYITKTSYNDQYRRFYPGIYVNYIAIRYLWNTKTLKQMDFLTDLQFHETWTDIVKRRGVIVMSRNPLLQLLIGSIFMNEKIKRPIATIYEKVMERIPLFAGFGI